MGNVLFIAARKKQAGRKTCCWVQSGVAFEPQQREILPLTDTQILLCVQNSKWSVTPSENLVSEAADPGDYKLGATHSKLCGFALRGFGNRA